MHAFLCNVCNAISVRHFYSLLPLLRMCYVLVSNGWLDGGCWTAGVGQRVLDSGVTAIVVRAPVSVNCAVHGVFVSYNDRQLMLNAG